MHFYTYIYIYNPLNRNVSILFHQCIVSTGPLAIQSTRVAQGVRRNWYRVIAKNTFNFVLTKKKKLQNNNNQPSPYNTFSDDRLFRSKESDKRSLHVLIITVFKHYFSPSLTTTTTCSDTVGTIIVNVSTTSRTHIYVYNHILHRCTLNV